MPSRVVSPAPASRSTTSSDSGGAAASRSPTASAAAVAAALSLAPGDGRGEGNLGVEEGGEQQDEGLRQLQRRDPVGVEPGHPRSERREEQRHGPEDERLRARPRRPDRGDAGPGSNGPAVVGGAGERRVVGGADRHARRLLLGLAVPPGRQRRRDHVLGGAPEKEERANEVPTAREIAEQRYRREQHEREGRRGRDAGEQAAGDPEQAVDEADRGPLRVRVGGFDGDRGPAVAEARGQIGGGATLGVGAGSALPEAAEPPGAREVRSARRALLLRLLHRCDRERMPPRPRGRAARSLAGRLRSPRPPRSR